MTRKSMTTQQTLFTPSSKPWNPHAYQRKAVKFLLEHAAAALFLDPGLGKTSIVLAALKILIKKSLVSKVLIIAPVRVAQLTWPAELEKWSDFHGLRAVVLHGTDKEELLKTEADIYLVNPEGLEWLLDLTKFKTPSGKTRVEVNMKRWRELGFDTLVIDELTKFKHTTASRYKALKQVLNTFGRRWGLTGSPAANGLMDLFPQCYVLDQGRSLGQYISHFRSKYFNPGWAAFTWVLKKGADEEIYERIKPLALRMSAEDYLEMPKLIENNIKVQLPPKVMEIYLQLEAELVTQLSGGRVTAATASVAIQKCWQVANGGIYLNQDVKALVKLPKATREVAHLHDLKTDVIEDLVEELQGSPLLVGYYFNHDLERLLKRFGQKTPVIGSGTTAKELKIHEAAWNSGKYPLMFAHPQSAGHGLNLQGACHHVAMYSLIYDFELYDQFIRRVRRQGQKETQVFVHHILADGTVDEQLLGTLKSKNRGQQAFFQALKARYVRK